jgi:nucleotide-binding universal stress UspA family protein
MTSPPAFEYGVDGPRTVMVGADGTEPSLGAVDYALGHARRTRATVVGVFVRPITLPDWSVVGSIPWVCQDIYDDCLRETASYLRGRADEMGVKHVLVERHGDPVRELACAADELRADLVVLGCPERTGHRITGSLPSRLVRMARWPVLVRSR